MRLRRAGRASRGPLNADVRWHLGLLAWFRKERAWRQEHIAAFRDVSAKQGDGLTQFQHRCLSAIESYVPAANFARVPTIEGDYLVAPIGTKGLKVYIYDNEAGLSGPGTGLVLEEWHYKLPDELIAALVEECASRAT